MNTFNENISSSTIRSNVENQLHASYSNKAICTNSDIISIENIFTQIVISNYVRIPAVHHDGNIQFDGNIS
jgi:hypothetical protein